MAGVMRTAWIWLLMIGVGGCRENVTVLGSDGTHVITDCTSDVFHDRFMVPCLRKMCPAGLIILPGDQGSNVAQCLAPDGGR